jgi:hypothetical protein
VDWVILDFSLKGPKKIGKRKNIDKCGRAGSYFFRFRACVLCVVVVRQERLVGSSGICWQLRFMPAPFVACFLVILLLCQKTTVSACHFTLF